MQISTLFVGKTDAPSHAHFRVIAEGGILLSDICLENLAFKGCLRDTCARIILLICVNVYN